MIEPEPGAEQPGKRAASSQPNKRDRPAGTFPLVIDLTEGFKNDTIILRLDEEEVYRASGVSTNWSAGIADTTTVEAPAGASTLTVAVPTRKLAQAVEFVVTEPLFIVVAIGAEGLEINTHTTPPSTYF